MRIRPARIHLARTQRFWSAALVIAGLQCGCTVVGPTFERPVTPIPASFAAAHGGDAALAAPAASTLPVTTAARWSSLSDPTLDKLLALAAQGNADLLTAATRVLQSRSLEATAAAQHGPQVSSRASAARQRLSENGSSTRLVGAIPGVDKTQLLSFLAEPFPLYQAGFDASWELDLWGRVKSSIDAAQAQTNEARANLAQMNLTVVAELVKNYLQLRSVQRQLALLRSEVQMGQEAESILVQQARGGLIDESALLRKRVQNTDIASRSEGLLAQEALAMNRVTLLCGVSPGTLNAELGAASTPPPPLLPDLSLGVPSELVRNRPDIVAAEARLAAATANIGVAVADLYPRITLGASFGFESLTGSQFAEWSSRQWSVGPALSLPIFDQGRRRATIVLREQQQQEAAINYRQKVLRSWHEVDDAVSTYVSEGRRQALATRRFRDSEATRALARARYEKGATDYLPVLNADHDLTEAVFAQTESSGRLTTHLVALYKALGNDGSLNLAAFPFGKR